MNRQRPPSRTKRSRAARSRASSTAAESDGDRCGHWELRFLIALHVGYYLAIRIQQPYLRERVIDHLAVGWSRSGEMTGGAGTFDDFFDGYLADVERDVDPKASDLDWEYRRVWTNHASVLGGEVDLVHARPA